MRKTLKRLKKDALGEVKEFIDTDKRLMKRLTREGHMVVLDALDAIYACIRYIEGLEDYGYELDEKWDKLLKTVEQTKQGKPDRKKPSYRV